MSHEPLGPAIGEHPVLDSRECQELADLVEKLRGLPGANPADLKRIAELLEEISDRLQQARLKGRRNDLKVLVRAAIGAGLSQAIKELLDRFGK